MYGVPNMKTDKVGGWVGAGDRHKNCALWVRAGGGGRDPRACLRLSPPLLPRFRPSTPSPLSSLMFHADRHCAAARGPDGGGGHPLCDLCPRGPHSRRQRHPVRGRRGNRPPHVCVRACVQVCVQAFGRQAYKLRAYKLRAYKLRACKLRSCVIGTRARRTWRATCHPLLLPPLPPALPTTPSCWPPAPPSRATCPSRDGERCPARVVMEGRARAGGSAHEAPLACPYPPTTPVCVSKPPLPPSRVPQRPQGRALCHGVPARQHQVPAGQQPAGRQLHLSKGGRQGNC